MHELRYRLFQFLVAPAHLWIFLCGVLTGVSVRIGRVTEDGRFEGK